MMGLLGGFLPRVVLRRVRWARILAISALSVGRSLRNATVSARLLLGTTGSGMAGMCGCGGRVVGGSGAGPIGGAELGARMGAEAAQLAETIGWLSANLEHGMASDRPSFALVFEGKVSFSRFLFPPTWYWNSPFNFAFFVSGPISSLFALSLFPSTCFCATG